MSYDSLKSRKRRIFLPTSYIQGQVREAKEAVESARAGLSPQKRGREKEKKKTKEGGLSPQEGDVRKRRKEKKKTKKGKKVAPAKARFRVPYTKNFFFWFTSIWVWKRPVSGEVSAPAWLREAMCKGSSGNGLLYAAKAEP